jgi:AcrR family transcriptional regulator
VAPEKPRKRPLQARSSHTVEAIYSGFAGWRSRTADDDACGAGASVGSLYQYFPNKQSLMAAVLERHLLHVVEAVEAACEQSKGQKIQIMASAVIDGFFKAKLDQSATSKALYAVAAEVGGEAIVNRMAMRSQLALCGMLATASDCRFQSPAVIAFMISTAAVGPVQALLASNSPPEFAATVRAHLKTMMMSYLKASALPSREGR